MNSTAQETWCSHGAMPCRGKTMCGRLWAAKFFSRCCSRAMCSCCFRMWWGWAAKFNPRGRRQVWRCSWHWAGILPGHYLRFFQSSGLLNRTHRSLFVNSYGAWSWKERSGPSGRVWTRSQADQTLGLCKGRTYRGVSLCRWCWSVRSFKLLIGASLKS